MGSNKVDLFTMVIQKSRSVISPGTVFIANNGFKTGQSPTYLPSPCRYNFFPAELQGWL